MEQGDKTEEHIILKNQIQSLEKTITHQNVEISLHVKEKSELKMQVKDLKKKNKELEKQNLRLESQIKNAQLENSLLSLNEKNVDDNLKKNGTCKSSQTKFKDQKPEKLELVILEEFLQENKNNNESMTKKKNYIKGQRRSNEKVIEIKQRPLSIQKNIQISKNLKNLNYNEFINKFSKKDNHMKIESLMDLCNPNENPLKNKIEKKLSSTLNPSQKIKSEDVTKKKNDLKKNVESPSYNDKLKISVIKEESFQEIISSKLSISDEITITKNFENIFSDFFIISCDKSRLHEYIRNKAIDFRISFSLNKNKIDDPENLVQYFVPFKQKIRIIRINNTVSELNEILFKDKNQKYDFFCVALNSNLNLENIDLDKFPILKDSNCRVMKYYYVAKVDDYFIEGDYISDDSSNKFIFVHYHSKYYVFETFYPLSSFYESVLQNYIWLNKKIRIEKFMKTIQTGVIQSGNLEKIDSFNMEEEEVRVFMLFKEKLLGIKINNNYEKKFTIDLNTNMFDLYLPSKKFAGYISGEFGYSNILNNFTFEEFLFIYLCILHEKNIIFVSNINFRISAAISTFLALLAPFKWEFPVIYNLPEDCLSMIGSPIPLIIGLKQTPQNVLGHLLSKYSDEDNESNIIIFIDDKLIYYHNDILKDILIPEYDDFYNKLKKLYLKNFNKESSSYFKINSKTINKNKIHYFKKKNGDSLKEKFLKLSKGMIYKNKSIFEDLRISTKTLPKLESKQIFYFFKYFFLNFIISRIPYTKDELILENETKLDDIDVDFFSSNQGDIDFLNSFFKTQAFVQFLEKEFFK